MLSLVSGFFWFYFSFCVPVFLADTVQPTTANFLSLSLPGLCLIYCVVFEFCSEEGITTFLVGFLFCMTPEYRLFSMNLRAAAWGEHMATVRWQNISWFVLHCWRWISTGFVQCTYCTDCRSVTWAPGFSVLGSKCVLWTGGTLGSGLLKKVPQPVQSLLRTFLPPSSMPLAQLLTEGFPGPVQLWQKLIPGQAPDSRPCSTRHSRFLQSISEGRVAGTYTKLQLPKQLLSWELKE